MKLFAIALAVVLTTSAASACSTGDIKIKNWNWHLDGDYAIYVGELVNECADETGVQLQVVFRDSSGVAVDADEFWPASTRNIGAGASYVFKSMMRWNPASKRGEIAVIDVKTW
jgi:ABC-type glycerol-3-phosphate transport system substrate-binding protein